MPANLHRAQGVRTIFGDSVAAFEGARRVNCVSVAYDEVHWFWSDQYGANLQYAGFHATWQQLVVRGRTDSDSYRACYVNDGRIDDATHVLRPIETDSRTRGTPFKLKGLSQTESPIGPRIMLFAREFAGSRFALYEGKCIRSHLFGPHRSWLA